MNKAKPSAVVALLLLCGTTTAGAQVYVPPPVQVPPPADFGNILVTREIGRTAATKRPGKGKGGKSHAAAAGRTTTFKFDGFRSVPWRLAVQIKKQAMRGKSGAVYLTEGEEIEKRMEAFFNHCLDRYEKQALVEKSPRYDTAHAVAFAIARHYRVYRGSSTAALTPQQKKGLYDSVRGRLLANPDFRAMSDRDRQKMYETVIIDALRYEAGYDGAVQQGDETAKAAFRQRAGEALTHLLGTSPDKIQLGGAGLVVR